MADKKITVWPGYNGVLGLTQTADGFQAAVDKKQAKEVSLRLYDPKDKTIVDEIFFPKESCIGQIASVQLTGIRCFPWLYTFVLDGKEIPDPFAGIIYGREVFGTDRIEGCLCGYLQPKYAARESQYLAAQDTLLYKLHVRGCSMDASSGVRRKGTFAGVKERLGYIRELGMSGLVLMPCYDFFERKPHRTIGKYEVPEEMAGPVNYWGYTDGFYFAPKASYCYGKNPQKEFADLVQAAHSAGLAVYMEFYFGKEATVALISRVLLFWKQQYGVDGFAIFGPAIPVSELGKHPALTSTRLIFSYADEQIYGEDKPVFRHVATADNHFQCCVRSYMKSDENQLHAFMQASRSNPPYIERVNYVASHDGFTLQDTVSYDFRHNEANGEDNRDGSWQNYSWNCGEEGPSRKKQILSLRTIQKKNALMMLYLAQGIPMLYAGDECGNSQQGNNNAWCQDNPLGWVNYSRKKADKSFLQFVRQLIAFRRAHPVFSMEKQPRNTDYQAKGAPDLSYHSARAWVVGTEPADRSVGMLYNGAYVETETEKYLYVIYSMYWGEADFALPTLDSGWQWCLLADTRREETFIAVGQEEHLPDQKMVKVTGRCVQIYCARKTAEPEKKPVKGKCRKQKE